MSKHEISNLEELSADEFNQRVERARAMVVEIGAMFPGMTILTAEERLYSDGKMKTDEAPILRLVLDAVDHSPQYFSSLADQDDGYDPNQFETPLLRERLFRREALHRLADDLDGLSVRLSDAVMHLGSRVRRPVLAAYKIGKSVAKSDAALRRHLAPVMDYYSRPAKRRAKKKQAS